MRASDRANRPPKTVAASILLNGEHAFNVTFDANKITRYWAQHSDGDDNDIYALYKALCDVLDGWDVVNDDGSPYPLTPEAMAELRFSFGEEREIVSQIVMAAQPSSAEGNASSAGISTPPSDSTAQPPTSPNGQVTSPSPAPSASLSPT